MLLKIEIPFIASSSGSLFCLNIAEKAVPIYQGIDPGPISVFRTLPDRDFHPARCTKLCSARYH
jgi:hypothetical protein